MKTIFVLYVSLIGQEYEYQPILEFYNVQICLTAAEIVKQNYTDYHAFCLEEQIITQPDGSVRPIARPIPGELI